MKAKTKKGALHCALILALLICGSVGATLTAPVFASTESNIMPITFTGNDSGKEYSDGSFTNERITVNVTDTSYEKLYYRLPTMSSFTYTRNKKYISGHTNGNYTVYAGNDDGTRSAEYSFFYDSLSPEGTILSNGTIIENGSTIKDSFSFSANDSGSGIAQLYYKTPLDNSYKEYSADTIIPLYAEDGEYCFYAEDRAGNISETYSVRFEKDTAPAVGKWITDEKELQNNGYTNKPLSFFFDSTDASATYIFNSKELGEYVSGQILTENGTYTIVLTDNSLNQSVFTAHIVTNSPIGQIYADNKPVSNGITTNKSIFFSWDGDIIATVNGAPYAKNGVLSEDAVYRFVLTDLAGNSAEYTATIDTEAPAYNADKLNKSQQLISRWYIANIDGTNYSFATYDEALAFACDKEFEKDVSVLVLDDISTFNQPHLIASGDVRTGEYWLYKSQANSNSLLYYFDRTVLDEVIAHYAKRNVSFVNYFEQGGDNVYGKPTESMNDNRLTAHDGTKAPALNNFVFDKVDGSELYAELLDSNSKQVEINYGIAFDEQISVAGLYKLTELDEAGNKTVFYGFLDTMPPELKVTATIIGNSEPTELEITKQSITGGAAFYYESFRVNEIVDTDKWSVLTVVNGGKKSYYTYGDELPFLNVGGEYSLTVYDRFGNSYMFTVYIIGKPASITFKNNSDDTEFNMTVTLGQKFDTPVMLEIYKNGLLIDGVSTDKLSYSFDRSGTYTVILRDIFGRIISEEYTFYKSLPKGNILGVVNDGKTKSDVTFTYDSEKYYAVVTKDGQALATELSGEIVIKANDENSGNYTIRLIRLSDEDNFTDYGFTVNTLAPNIALSVENNATTNKNVTVSWTANDIVKVVYSLAGGEPAELKNGAALSAEGVYIVTATNDLGTQSVKTFTIDKTLDYRIEVGAEPARNVEVTNESFAVFNDEALSVSVMKNGEPYDYMFGDILSEEGFYTFRIADDYGNTATFSVTIDKSVSYSANIGNGLIASEDVKILNEEKLTITVTKDNQLIDYKFGQILDREGYYKVVMKDAYGNNKSLEFRIVKGVKRTLDYTLGESVSVLTIDRNGEAVSPDGNRLYFTESGLYTVTAEVDGKAYSFVLELDSTAPTLDLIGVSNGGVSGKSVTLDNFSEQASVEVFKDGELIKYELGSELKEYGEYRVVVTDKAGNQTEYTFTLKHILNGGAVALIVIGIIVLVGGVAAVLFMRKKGIFGKIKALKTDSKKPKRD